MKKQYSLLAILACLLWSTVFFVIKYELSYMSPLNFAGLRFMLAGLLLLPVVGNLRNYFIALSKNIKHVFLVSLLQTFLLYGTFFIGISMVRGAQTAIIIGASPIVTAILAHFLMHNDKMSLRKILYLSIGLLGIFFISLSSNPWQTSGLKELLGMSILLLGTVVSSLGNITVAKKHKDINPVILNSAQMFLGGLGLFIVSIFIEGLPDLFDLPFIFYSGFLWVSFVSAAAFSIWFYLLGKVKVSKINMWKFLIPLFGALFSWLILPTESADTLSLGGMLLIVFSIVGVLRN